jgi:hypothetical protein
MLHNLHSFLFKVPLFHNSTSFGSCIIRILNTGVQKFKKKAGTKGLNGNNTLQKNDWGG